MMKLFINLQTFFNFLLYTANFCSTKCSLGTNLPKFVIYSICDRLCENRPCPRMRQNRVFSIIRMHTLSLSDMEDFKMIAFYSVKFRAFF